VKESTVYTERESYPVKLANYEFKNSLFECEDENGLVLRVHVISEFILRVRYAIEGVFENDFSYGIDPDLESKDIDAHIDEAFDALYLHTSALTCKIDKKNLDLTFMDKSGNVINHDEKSFHWEPNDEHGGHIVQMTKVIQDKEAFYGLGDKPIDLNLRGKRFVNWGTDEYGYHKGTDPIYKSIPIYYGLHNGIGYGIFFDNTYRSYFDFGKERKSVMSFWAQGGEMNYYFIAGPNLMDACKRYTLLTGTAEMPPMWALGYQQCKWSYFPESQVKEIAGTMRALKIPCDAIYLDIDYMDGFRCFTWDNEKFPDPKGMVDELKADGFKTMVIIDPGIKKDKDYPIFQEALEKGYFCKHIDGGYVQGKVWPGECYFPDFTKPEVREWWAGLYKELIEEIGVAGVWNDMNEPALFEVETKTFPLNVVHDYDGNLTGHRKAHNVYGMQMARATQEGVKKYRNGKRTLIITRSGYSGLQRYSSVWTGDNIATWEHLWIADVQTQRLAISGVSFCGSDIGGFIEQPTGELFVRWIQLGIFHPFCRVHSSGDHGEQEPWSFGEPYTGLFRKFVELRYKLLPYIYTSFYQYYKEGMPMLRPISFVDQLNDETIDRDHEFLCGDHILVCPVVNEGAKSRKVYLPSGQWYHFWTNEEYEGQQTHQVNTPMDQIPCFVKAGAIVPEFPIQQYVGEKVIEEIKLNIYYKHGIERSQFYDDDRETYGYEQNEFLLAEFEMTGENDKVIIDRKIKGKYQSKIKSFELILKGIPFEIDKIICDGNEIDFSKESIVVKSDFKQLALLK